jgi:uncharacterized membrane protein YdbT with pleckstrin-like domain
VGYVERYLLPQERVLYKTRLHWLHFAKPLLATVVGVLLGSFLYYGGAEPPWLWYLGAALAGAGAVWLIVRWVEWGTSEFAVTSLRLIFKVGLMARYTTELLLSKVESISVTQSLLGRLANYGDLTVTGTGAVWEVFRRVQDPVGFRNAVQHASANPATGE